MSLLLYLALLPLAVWILAGAFALLDGGPSNAALKTLGWRLLPLLLLALVLGRSAAWPMVLALITSLALHTGAVLGLRIALSRSLFPRE